MQTLLPCSPIIADASGCAIGASLYELADPKSTGAMRYASRVLDNRWSPEGPLPWAVLALTLSVMTRPSPSVHVELSGGCACGRVRYAVASVAHELLHCHCSVCRRTHGSMFASYAAVPRGTVSITTGSDLLGKFVSSPAVRRYFCRNCGCQLLIEDDRGPQLIWYAVATLDSGHPGHSIDREQHVFLDSRVSWFHLAEPVQGTTATPADPVPAAHTSKGRSP